MKYKNTPSSNPPPIYPFLHVYKNKPKKKTLQNEIKQQGLSFVRSSTIQGSRRFLAQHKVDDAGDKGKNERDPSQDEGGAIPAISLVLMKPVCVDGCSDHDAQAGQELEDAREGEPSALGEGEKLGHKYKEAQDGEDACQH